MTKIEDRLAQLTMVDWLAIVSMVMTQGDIQEAIISEEMVDALNIKNKYLRIFAHPDGGFVLRFQTREEIDELPNVRYIEIPSQTSH